MIYSFIDNRKQKKKEEILKQKFKKLDELKKKKEAELKLSKSVGKKDGVGKKGGANVHSVAAAAGTATYRQRYGDTKANDIVS
jgi:hypothetical protein